MNQRLSDWASVAEILGAVAIVISLFFVGLQIGDGNREARAATTQAALDAEMLFQAELLQYAEIWEKVILGGDLSDEVETRRAIVLFNMLMTLYENRYQMINSGYLENSELNVGQFASVPFFETWRQSPGATARSAGFLELLDNLRDRGAAE